LKDVGVLSFAGRSTLIKVVAQAIPTYVMSCFLLPKELCNHLKSLICNFWWGSNDENRKIHWVKWSTICKHKKHGGLGFRELRAFNEALLAKQGWRCITQPNSLMAQILKAKYHPKTSFLRANTENRQTSYTWYSIQKASWVLRKGGLWNIGNGGSISIWNDCWLPRQQGHKVWTPKGDSTYQWVKELMIPETRWWNRQLVNNTFLPFEAEQILQIPIMNISRDDVFTWPRSRDGEYTVKSGYQAIKDWNEDNNNPSTSYTNKPNPTWQKLWKMKIPPKHSSLIWRILNNALPVTHNLRKRGINCYPLCYKCKDGTEDQDHVFSKCIWAQQIWFASPLTVRFVNPNQSFSDWLEDRINNGTSQSIKIVCAICYHIWKARNLLIFQNKSIPVMEAMTNALESLAEYKKQQQPTQTSATSTHRTNRNRSNNNESWKPPPQNSLKLNVDAHRLAGDGRWALGLILRMEDGKLVGARTKFVYGVGDAIEAEALGLDEAIEFSTLYKDRRIIIEMDNSEVVKAAQRNHYPRRYWGQIVRRSGEYIRANPNTMSI
jgi:hypothetical protein